jgi:hypothetical protein
MGTFLKLIGGRFLMRVYHPLRMIFDIFDQSAVNKEEKESFSNVDNFKKHINSLIDEKKSEMKDPKFNIKESFDFLTQLLTDELFKDDHSMMMDECMTFIGAAT